MHTLYRSFAGVLLGWLLITSNAWALDYYWMRSGSSTHYPSARAACPNTGTYSNFNGTFDSLIFANETSVGCSYRMTVMSSGEFAGYMTLYNAGRAGDSCPVGATYNTTIGGCEMPALEPGEECTDQTGATPGNPKIWDDTVSACVLFTESEGKAPCTYLASSAGESSYLISGAVSSGFVFAPPSFASEGTDCEIQTVRTSKCVIKVSGEGQCVVTGEYTGEVFGGGTDINDALCPDGGCPDNEPETTTDTQDCEPVSDGAGGTSCTTTKTTEAEGEQSCGTFNGVLTCTSKAPASNGVTTEITATTETEPDGDIKVTTVKDSSLTLCTNVNECTTKHSTTTSVTTTKPSGATSTTSSCTGACSSTGGGVETIPGAGTEAGTGSGTCIGDDCGTGEEEGTADVTQDCEATPPCEGDPFQCAVLKQAHIDTCKLMAGPTAEESAAQDAKIDAEYDALDAHQATMDSQVSGLLSGFQSATSGGGSGGGQCLPDLPFSVMGHSVTMEFSRACEPLSFVRLVLLAGAYLIAARIVSKEV